MKKDIELYFKSNPKIARVFVTKDGTFFPEKNKQDAERHQLTLKASIEAIQEVKNPAFDIADAEQDASAGDFINAELEEAKKELGLKESLLTVAKDALEEADKRLVEKQEGLAKLDEAIQSKGTEVKDLDASIQSKGKELQELEAKIAEAKKPKSIK